jgi:chromate transporter
MNVSLAYLFITFLRIGATSWGGFMALISMIQKKVVEQDGKLDNETIMEGISLASVLPGPMAVNVVSFVGYKLGGSKGAFVSIVGVVLPSFLLMLLLSHMYLTWGNIPAMNHFFTGILPAVAAIVLSVAISMGEKNIKDVPQLIIMIIAAAIVTFSKMYIITLGVLIVSGLFGYFYYGKTKTLSKSKPLATKPTDQKSLYQKSLLGLIVMGIGSLVVYFGNTNDTTVNIQKQIALTFSSMSLTQFGGGYVIIPTMQKIIVDGMHWLTNQEFIDAIAMGQITPGPIFISATFIGYKLAGFWGALNATIAIFSPTAIITLICSKFFNRIRKSNVLAGVFKGLRPAIIGMILSAAYSILASSGFTIFAFIIFALSQLLIMKLKIDPVYLIPAAGIAGLLIL